jgi:hypothetical protein
VTILFILVVYYTEKFYTGRQRQRLLTRSLLNEHDQKRSTLLVIELLRLIEGIHLKKNYILFQGFLAINKKSFKSIGEPYEILTEIPF